MASTNYGLILASMFEMPPSFEIETLTPVHLLLIRPDKFGVLVAGSR